MKLAQDRVVRRVSVLAVLNFRVLSPEGKLTHSTAPHV
jgi:hypothetical protein